MQYQKPRDKNRAYMFVFLCYAKMVPQIHHLKAQLALRKEEASAEADEFREHSLRQAEEVRNNVQVGAPF